MSLLHKRTRFDNLFSPPKKIVKSFDDYNEDDNILFSLLEEINEEDLIDFPNDTETAINILRSQSTCKPTVILKNHLYYLISDKSCLDRELIELQYKGIIKEFKLPHSLDSYYVYTSDIIDAMYNVKDQYINKLKEKRIKLKNTDTTVQHSSSLECGTLTGPPAIGFGLLSVPFTKDKSKVNDNNITIKPEDYEVFDLYIKYFIPSFIGTTIQLKTLLKILYPFTWKLKKFDAISPLINTGLLLLMNEGKTFAQGFQLVCPGVSSTITQINEGRKEILRKLRRCKYYEEHSINLENIKLKKSSFPPTYHIKDLLGGDYVEKIQSPSGLIIRLPSQ